MKFAFPHGDTFHCHTISNGETSNVEFDMLNRWEIREKSGS